MTVKKIINNKVPCIQFIDDKGEYLLQIAQIDLGKTEAEQIAIAQKKYDEIKLTEANPLPPTVQELREKEYLAQGITEKEMIVALWEKVVEGRNESADLIQAERIAIKAKYPKI